MASNGSAFPGELPPRPPQQQSFKERNCRGMGGKHGYLFERYSAYSLATSDKGLLAWRLCMIVILGERTALSILEGVRDKSGFRPASMSIEIGIAVVGCFSVAVCLARIGEVRGVRKIMGRYIGRWHFDIFLLAMAVVHTVLLITYFFGFVGAELSATWLLLWFLISFVTWITSWSPEIMENLPTTV
ncbi:hypothetical protein LTR85_009911 [Meristemomyces frigidus]|nr:hypothetical protein LTR85_009911 [Meristemomyces frigidus]